MNDNKEHKGYTLTYYSWDDGGEKPRVAGRFRTKKEKDEFLDKITQPGSGWLGEEISSICEHPDYNYILPY